MTTLTTASAEHKPNLGAAELHRRIRHGERLLLLDVRDYTEFAGGHIAGARLLPLRELEHRAAELDRNRPVVCVCRSGKRSAQAAATLTSLGFVSVAQLDGGLIAWEQAGLPMERNPHAPWTLERQVRFAAGLLVLLGLGLSLLWPAAIGLVWFVGAGLVFAAVTDWCGMGLLLAAMPWNRPPQSSRPSGQV